MGDAVVIERGARVIEPRLTEVDGVVVAERDELDAALAEHGRVSRRAPEEEGGAAGQIPVGEDALEVRYREVVVREILAHAGEGVVHAPVDGVLEALLAL